MFLPYSPDNGIITADKLIATARAEIEHLGQGQRIEWPHTPFTHQGISFQDTLSPDNARFPMVNLLVPQQGVLTGREAEEMKALRGVVGDSRFVYDFFCSPGELVNRYKLPDLDRTFAAEVGDAFFLRVRTTLQKRGGGEIYYYAIIKDTQSHDGVVVTQFLSTLLEAHEA